MSEIIETADGVSSDVAQRLKLIAGAMGGGLTMMAGLVAWTYINGAAQAAAPDQARLINLLTTVTMIVAVVCIGTSEFAWRRLLKASSGPLGVRVQGAFIIRLAMREAAGLLGLTIAYLAALNGVLKTYPAYWVNLAPFGLFLVFLVSHWPTAARLAAEAHEAIGK